MKIAVIGRGNVGGGLAERWRKAGHDVQEIGREGGDVSGSDTVVLAVPSTNIADALESVTGLTARPSSTPRTSSRESGPKDSTRSPNT